MKENMIQKASKFAKQMHDGQKRKDGVSYITHPEGVFKILKEEGITDETILADSWLHDTLEDTITTYKDLERLFGKTIADDIYLLSRNISRDEYKRRIENSNYRVQIVKLADTLHNVHDPYSMSHLSPRGIQRKIDDCESLYIPLAMKICQNIGYKLKESIGNYIRIFGGN